jgi:EPS-associated MarR family transcriptional regulator
LFHAIPAKNFKPVIMVLKDVIHVETHFHVLRLLESNPQMSQRELAKALGVSLGKVNYCLNALLDKGLLKVQNFQGSKSKMAYAYLLTPAGIAEKAGLTRRFLKSKMEEYEQLKLEIESLRRQAEQLAQKQK